MPAGHEMPMRVIFLTQEDPFYLTEAFRHILDHVPPGVMVVAAVVLGGSPFGERLSLVGKVRRTYEVFGPRFVGLYGWRFLRAKLGRSRTVASLFRRRGIEVLTPAGSVNAPEFLEALRLRYPDLLVSVGANQVFRRALIDLAPRGCLNLHSALLPRHRGLMPSFWALKHGDAETGSRFSLSTRASIPGLSWCSAGFGSVIAASIRSCATPSGRARRRWSRRWPR
jgi:methionyl-tRNA formyltransferase